MAVVAGIAAGDMRWVLTRRRCAVVTEPAGAKNLGVIDSICWCPDIAVVTILANIRCLNMRK